jgi:hypothetical protein
MFAVYLISQICILVIEYQENTIVRLELQEIGKKMRQDGLKIR